MLQLMHFSPRKTAEGFAIQKNEDSSGGKAIKNGPLQAGQRKARFRRRAFVPIAGFSAVGFKFAVFKVNWNGVSLSAAAEREARGFKARRSRALNFTTALVKDKLTSNCHFVDWVIFYCLSSLFFVIFLCGFAVQGNIFVLSGVGQDWKFLNSIDFKVSLLYTCVM